jgi:hypothetical protein
VRVFGAPDPNQDLAYALLGFFENGGSRASVVRVDEAGAQYGQSALERRPQLSRS